MTEPNSTKVVPEALRDASEALSATAGGVRDAAKILTDHPLYQQMCEPDAHRVFGPAVEVARQHALLMATFPNYARRSADRLAAGARELRIAADGFEALDAQSARRIGSP